MAPGTHSAHTNPDNGDPLNDAMLPPEPGRFSGQIKDIEMSEIGFKKLADGSWERPMPYDPEYHDFASKQIKFILLPLDARRPIKELEMGLNNRKNPEFRHIVQPAIFALGAKICQVRGIPEGSNLFRAMIGLWVFGEYVKRDWNKDGEDWTTLQFQDVFASETECQAHWDALRAAEGDEPLPFPGDAPKVAPPPAQAPPPAPNLERASMATFLPGLWDIAQKDITAFLTLISENPMVAKHFDKNSQEVRDAMEPSNDTEQPIAPF